MASHTRSDVRVLRIQVVDHIVWEPAAVDEATIALAEGVGRLDYICYSPLASDRKPRAITENSTAYPSRSRSKLHFFRDALALGSELQRQRHYDLIWTDDPMGSGLVGHWLRRRFGVPLLVKVHSDYYGNWAWRLENPRYLFDYVLSVWLLHRADAVQAVSQHGARQLERLGLTPNKITVLPTLMVPGHFPPGEDALARYAAGRILFAGQLVPTKRADVLLKAVHLLLQRGYQPRVTLAGRGPLEERLRRLARCLDLVEVVQFVGHLPHSELALLYQASSIFVLPSGQEAFGKVLVEAGLSSLPTVASRVSGVPELVADGETGLLVPPGNPEALADALARLLGDPGLAQRMGREARRRQQDRWNLQAHTAQYVALFERVRRAAG